MAKKNKETRYVERDVSWMYFNHRILQEARKENIPLLERLSFLGIYSNNLDEFFRVRMASLNRLLESDNKEIRKQHDNIRKTIKTINKLNSQFSQEYTVAIDEWKNHFCFSDAIRQPLAPVDVCAFFHGIAD